MRCRSGRAADQNLVHLALRRGLIVAGHGGDLAGQTLQRGLIELALGIGLLALVVVTV